MEKEINIDRETIELESIIKKKFLLLKKAYCKLEQTTKSSFKK